MDDRSARHLRLKMLMLLVLAFYAGEFILEILARLRSVVYIIVAAVFLAYLIYPAVSRLRRRMPLVLAIVVVYAGIVLALGIVTIFIVPHVVNDVQMLVTRYPDLVARYNSIISNPNDPIASHLPPWVRDELVRAPAQMVTWLKLRGLQVFGQIVVVLAGTVAIVALFIVVPVVTAYLLLDLDHLQDEPRRDRAGRALARDDEPAFGDRRRDRRIYPRSAAGRALRRRDDYDRAMLLHVPYPYLFGVLAFFGDLIPYVGAVLAFLPAFFSALLVNGWLNARARDGCVRDDLRSGGPSDRAQRGRARGEAERVRRHHRAC